MNIDTLQKRLEIWKVILFLNVGASITLTAIGIAYLSEIPRLNSAGWLGVWFTVQLASLLPGFVLLWGKHYIQIPLRERLNTIFGYFTVAWITFWPVGCIGYFKIFYLGCAIAIAIGYWWLRRKINGVRAEIFP